MKKLTIICVIVAIAILAVVPGAAFAETTRSTGGNLCLINPIAITAIGNYIFVADCVDTDHSVILCFDISSGTPAYRLTYTADKQITNLSETDGKLCVIFPDNISVFDVTGNVFGEPSATYALENVTDITGGKYVSDSTTHDAVYVLSEEDLFYAYLDDESVSFKRSDYALDIEEPMACLYVDGVDVSLDGYVYCIWQNDIKRFNTNEGQWGLRPDKFNSLGVYAPSLMIKGIFTYQIEGTWQTALYSDTEISKLEKRHFGPNNEGREWEFAATESVPLDRHETDNVIVDICYASDKIFLLNSNKQVEIYAYNTENSTFAREENTIGTDIITIDGALPTNFTEFFLAKSSGYPTNIIYKTTDSATSVESIIPDYCEQYIILGFDGAEDLPFYYVLIGDKYGWVKKSDGATTPASDPKIQPISTNLSGSNTNITYKAKFISANAVFIYELPVSGSNYTEFTQTVTTPRDVTVLQRFTEDTANGVVEWYYISYENADGTTQHGFIQSGLVGQFYTTTTVSDGNVYLEDKKVNSSLFNAVNIYATSDMSEKNAMCDKNGNIIKLYSGAFVKVISVDGDASYVEVKHNGTTSYGWLPTDKLINRISMTTNAIVGLSILGAALVIGIIFSAVLTHRKKRRSKVIVEQLAPTQIDESNDN